MATQDETQSLYDRIAALRETVTGRLSSSLVQNPQLADVLVKQIDDLLSSAEAEDAKAPVPPDRGLAKLVGVGPEAATDLGVNRLPQGVQPYDETVTSERILAVGDLYYIYQHEKIGVFRVVQKLQELFRGGAVRLSTGEGAYGLYQFDRREVLRYTRRDRHVSYRRVLGYGNAQRAARRGDAAPRRGIQDPQRRRRQAALRRRHGVGRGGGRARASLQRAPHHLAAATHGRHRPRGAALARPAAHPADVASAV